MYPGPDHFLSRPETEDGKPGPIVPLIAVDQLPDWMQLVGVPRELDIEQATGLTNLGIVGKEDDDIYDVRLHQDKIRAILNGTEKTASSPSSGGEGKAKNTSIGRSPSSEAQAKSEYSKKDTQVTTNPPSLPGPNVIVQHQTSSSPQGKQDGDASKPGTTSPPIPASAHEGSTPRPQKQETLHPAQPMLSASRHNTTDDTTAVAGPAARGEKPMRPHMTQAMRDRPRPAAVRHTSTREDTSRAAATKRNNSNMMVKPGICRHWCHHGTCKWDTDCRNQHRMPTTPEGLREVGLKGIPRWYLLWLESLAGGDLGGRSPSMAAHTGVDINSLLGELGIGDLPEGFTLIPRPDNLTTATPPTLSHLEAFAPRQAPAAHHPSATDLRLVSALVAGIKAISDRHVQEARGTRAPSRPNTHHTSTYANLHTNASLAANAADIRRQAERQQQQQLGRLPRRGRLQQLHMHMMSDLPVATRAARARAADVEGVDNVTGEDGDVVTPDDSASRAGRDSLVTCVEDEGQQCRVHGRDGDSQSPGRASNTLEADSEELIDV